VAWLSLAAASSSDTCEHKETTSHAGEESFVVTITLAASFSLEMNTIQPEGWGGNGRDSMPRRCSG